MKHLVLAATLVIASVTAGPLRAGPANPQAGTAQPAALQTPQDALTACLLASTTDQDRLVLVQWIFLVISRYPDVSSMIQVKESERQRINQQAGGIFERLMVNNCGGELKLALTRSGTDAISKSFEVLGQTAMGTLLQNPAVNAESAAVMNNVDLDRLIQLMQEK